MSSKENSKKIWRLSSWKLKSWQINENQMYGQKSWHEVLEQELLAIWDRKVNLQIGSVDAKGHLRIRRDACPLRVLRDLLKAHWGDFKGWNMVSIKTYEISESSYGQKLFYLGLYSTREWVNKCSWSKMISLFKVKQVQLTICIFCRLVSCVDDVVNRWLVTWEQKEFLIWLKSTKWKSSQLKYLDYWVNLYGWLRSKMVIWLHLCKINLWKRIWVDRKQLKSCQ